MRAKHPIALHTSLIAAAIALATQATATDFTPLSFENASKQAKEEARLLLVYVSADWTGASQFMEKEVWPDKEVTNWMSKHAIVKHIDFDESTEEAKELGIRTLPAVLAYHDGELISQLKEYDHPDSLLAWSEDTRLRLFEPHKLEAVLEARLPREVLDLKKKGSKGDMGARLSYARELIRLNEFGAATREFTWLWKNIEKHDQSMGGVRASFMLSNIEDLIELYPPARDAFESIRNNTGERVTPGRRFSIDAFNDWIDLSQMLGDTQPLI
ncbi:MAG: thioredoxin family protein, partial [Planctomycetota bacterium]